jgi:hypothetical protein
MISNNRWNNIAPIGSGSTSTSFERERGSVATYSPNANDVANRLINHTNGNGNGVETSHKKRRALAHRNGMMVQRDSVVSTSAVRFLVSFQQLIN